jgi:deoxyribodipyrimidine photo-lyase
MKINIFWFRRDLRLEDNTALNHALSSGLPVLPVFIFDTNITGELERDDARISFIHKTLSSINDQLNKSGSSVYVLKGTPEEIWKELTTKFDINAVYINKDYEPYSIHRDDGIGELLQSKGVSLVRFRDQVIFEENEVVKSDGKPYTVFTPYKNRWLSKFNENRPENSPGKAPGQNNFLSCSYSFPSLRQIGFTESQNKVRPYDLSVVPEYQRYRDLPGADRTSYLSPHLRFGTVSIRKLVKTAMDQNMSFLNELMWREFFMQILFHFPAVVTDNFKPVYDNIEWRNDENEFQRWCNGETGYHIVDAGMHQLNKTGFMHNRVRMIAAGFLCKHLLIDWRWGEAYFAQKLLDYELSSNNGNWQWAAGTGCDAAPYFRIFNPETQQKRFDPKQEYIRKWVETLNKPDYPGKIIDHDFARQRALAVYKSGIKKKTKKI